MWLYCDCLACVILANVLENLLLRQRGGSILEENGAKVEQCTNLRNSSQPNTRRLIEQIVS